LVAESDIREGRIEEGIANYTDIINCILEALQYVSLEKSELEQRSEI